MSEEERFKVFVAAYVVLRQGAKFLLQKRIGRYMGGKYSLPAGHLEAGETAMHAIIREAYEEIGIELRQEHLHMVHIMHRKNPDREYVDFFMEAHEWNGAIENKEPEKCEELAWFDADFLPDNMVPEVRSALECIGRGQWYSEFGF